MGFIEDQEQWHAIGFEDGLNAAWECARKIISDVNHNGLSAEAMHNIFGTHDLNHIMNSYTAKEVIQKIESYELINIGDEVTRIGEIGVVLVKDNNRHQVYVLTYNEIHVWHIDDIEKTGRHFDQVQDLIQQMRTITV